jgi:RNA:NAD 2'-phosphotransferase (TPT1/KptA family)
MELLYHATTVERLPSILKKGILISKSTGQRRVVWCCRQKTVPWACMHTAQRHKTTIKDVVVIAFKTGRKHLRHHGKGLWYSTESIPPESIQQVLTFALVAK